jgi:Flp pilus assembly pilin Flp
MRKSSRNHSNSLGIPTQLSRRLKRFPDRSQQCYSVGLLAKKKGLMQNLLSLVWSEDGQDIAEYAVMLAVILVIVVGTIRLVGSNANNAFSSVASSIH